MPVGSSSAIPFREPSNAAKIIKNDLRLVELSVRAGKDVVQLPRLFLLATSFAVPFYALAKPTPQLGFYVVVFWLVAYAVSGYAYVASLIASPKNAQLLVVVWILVLTMLSPPSQTLAATDENLLTSGLAWLSPIRWAGESLVTRQTRDLSYAWKMPPSFFLKPERDSALVHVLRYPFHEGWLYDLDVAEKKGTGGTTCVARGRWIKNEELNLPVLIALGIGARIVALVLLVTLDRDKLGEAPLGARAAAVARRIVAKCVPKPEASRDAAPAPPRAVDPRDVDVEIAAPAARAVFERAAGVSGGSVARIAKIDRRGPSAAAGLSVGDVVVALDGAAVGYDDFVGRVASCPRPRVVAVRRGGETVDEEVGTRGTEGV